MAPQYEVVFDLQRAGYQPPLQVLVMGGVVLAIALTQVLTRWTKRTKWFAATLLVVSLTWLSVSWWGHWREYQRLVASTNSGAVSIAEGAITEFQGLSLNGNGTFRFTVANQAFATRFFEVTPAYRGTLGLDLSGACARVATVRDANTNSNRIVWLGMRRPCHRT
jgi:hypothetical protein